MIIGLCPQTVYAENETGQAENSQQTAEQGEGIICGLGAAKDSRNTVKKQEYGHMVPAFLKSMMPEA